LAYAVAAAHEVAAGAARRLSDLARFRRPPGARRWRRRKTPEDPVDGTKSTIS